MTFDGKNDQTITRNILGLPCLIEAGDGDMVEISYLSDGTKRYTIADNGEGPYYYGSFIYAYDEAAGETQLESIGHGEGRFSATSYTSLHEPVFSNLHYVTDRVGSVVAVVDLDSVENDGTDAVLEGNGYTPFGERFAIGGFPKMHLNRFRFNGKEHLNRLSLPYVDYDARYYDPTIARWHRPDPMADKYPDISPYAFCGNDPVNFVDPTGEDAYVAGSGTKEDPFVITAVYFYSDHCLRKDQIDGLLSAVKEYNDRGVIQVKGKNGNIFVKFNLSTQLTDDPEKARLSTSFTTQGGDTRYYGHIVTTESDSSNPDHFGSANNISIWFCCDNIDSAIHSMGCDTRAINIAVGIHEIAHTLGAEHEDRTAVMKNVEKRSDGSISYPYVDKRSAKSIIGKINQKNYDRGVGSIWKIKD